MVTGAGVRVNAKLFTNDTLALFDALLNLRLHSALAVQHAFTLRHDHLGAFGLSGQGITKGASHLIKAVGVRDGFDPVHPDTFDSFFNRVVGASNGVDGFGRQNVLAACCCRITIVDHQ